MQSRRAAAKLLQNALLRASDSSRAASTHCAEARGSALCQRTRQGTAQPQAYQRLQLRQIGRRGYAVEAQEVDTGLQMLEDARRRSKLWQRFGIIGMIMHPCPCHFLMQFFTQDYPLLTCLSCSKEDGKGCHLCASRKGKSMTVALDA